jgi:hypothetical protein
VWCCNVDDIDVLDLHEFFVGSAGDDVRTGAEFGDKVFGLVDRGRGADCDYFVGDVVGVARGGVCKQVLDKRFCNATLEKVV